MWPLGGVRRVSASAARWWCGARRARGATGRRCGGDRYFTGAAGQARGQCSMRGRGSVSHASGVGQGVRLPRGCCWQGGQLCVGRAKQWPQGCENSAACLPRLPLPLSGAAVLELMAERLVCLVLLTGDAATGATARDSVGTNKLSYTTADGDLTGTVSHTGHTSSAMLHLDSQD